MFFAEPQTLIVVYKEELHSNFLKKLVETNDDKGDDEVVGTRDGSVHIVAWTEKIWRDQKKAGIINNKVLFLGDIKGTDKLLPIIDIKYDEYGVQYGWAGNQAILHVDSKTLRKEGYEDFFESFCTLPVPENMKVNAIKTAKEDETKKNASEEQQEKKRIIKAVKGAAIGVLAGPVGAASGAVAAIVSDMNAKIQMQQYIFGICKLYENHLEQYMNK